MQQLELDQKLFGTVTLLRGDPSLIKRLCISLAIKLQSSGRPSYGRTSGSSGQSYLGQPLFIDSANSFDPYIIQKTCKHPKEVLNNILISRPFTLEQLKSLIDKLEELAPDHKVVIISSIDLLCRDFQGKEKELFIVFRQMLERLQKTTRKYGLITFAGCHEVMPEGFLDEYADFKYGV